jgi:RNAse (barnase) inhibitor barstar
MTVSKLLASQRPGVYRCALFSASEAISVCPSHPNVVRIGVAGMRDKLAFLSTLSKPLGFSAHFGRSWEAFYEALMDLANRTETSLAIVFDDLSGFARGEREEFDAAVDTLRDAVDYWRERGKRLTVLVGLDQPALAPDLPDAESA